MKRRKYGDWLLLCFILGIIGGTVAANVLSVEVQNQAGYLGRMMAAGSSISSLEKRQLFFSVLAQRFLETGILWLLSLTVFSFPCYLVLSSYGGLSLGMMISVLTCQKGIMGLPVYLSSVFPHYLCYVPVWLILASCAGREKGKIHLGFVVLGAAVLILGVWSEASLNPYFLKFFL